MDGRSFHGEDPHKLVLPREGTIKVGRVMTSAQWERTSFNQSKVGVDSRKCEVQGASKPHA